MTRRALFRITLEQHVVVSLHTVLVAALFDICLAIFVAAEDINGDNEFSVSP